MISAICSNFCFLDAIGDLFFQLLRSPVHPADPVGGNLLGSRPISSHSRLLPQLPKPSASIWRCMASVRLARSGCPCGSCPGRASLAATNRLAEALRQLRRPTPAAMAGDAGPWRSARTAPVRSARATNRPDEPPETAPAATRCIRLPLK